jgi:hypothetical protein
MAKRITTDSDSELDPATIRLVLLKSVNLEVVGNFTGNTYWFYGAGSEQEVDVRDAEHLLNRKIRSCCSGLEASPYFDVVR